MQRHAFIFAGCLSLAFVGAAQGFVHSLRDGVRGTHSVHPQLTGGPQPLPPATVTPPTSPRLGAERDPEHLHSAFLSLRGNALTSAAELCAPPNSPRFTAQLHSLDERDIAPPSAVASRPPQRASGRTPVLLASIFMTAQQ